MQAHVLYSPTALIKMERFSSLDHARIQLDTTNLHPRNLPQGNTNAVDAAMLWDWIDTTHISLVLSFRHCCCVCSYLTRWWLKVWNPQRRNRHTSLRIGRVVPGVFQVAMQPVLSFSCCQARAFPSFSTTSSLEWMGIFFRLPSSVWIKASSVSCTTSGPIRSMPRPGKWSEATLDSS